VYLPVIVSHELGRRLAAWREGGFEENPPGLKAAIRAWLERSGKVQVQAPSSIPAEEGFYVPSAG
jgi:hypothetical protein